MISSIIKKQYFSHKSFYLYLAISIFVTVLDMTASRISEKFVDIIIANSIGIITGFIIQYFLTSKHVYNSKSIKTFVKFLLTFFFGFILANSIIYICRVLIFGGSENFFAFIVSKGFSIIIPFFIIYFIRKYWIKQL